MLPASLARFVLGTGTQADQAWARRNLVQGVKVYDKDGFVSALLHQSFRDVQPVFVVA